MVNPRLQMTELVMRALDDAEQDASGADPSLYPAGRRSCKAAKRRKFRNSNDAPGSRALADYTEALKVLMEQLEPARKDETHSVETT